MSLIVYAVRHGESEDNRLKRFGGQSQAPLSEKGRQDAVRAGKMLADVHFDRVYASDLERALETCRIAMPEAEPVIDSRLREISVGSLQGKLREDFRREIGSEKMDDMQIRRDYSAYGGETNADQYRRVAAFMREIEHGEPEGTVVVFTHEGTVKAMAAYAFGAEVEPKHLKLANGCAAVFELRSQGWRLLAWNLGVNIQSEIQ